MAKFVLLRHGQSLWNLENIFTGWTDIDLSEKGRLEAQTAGRLLQHEKYLFDAAFCSVLLRAENTLKIALQTMNLSIPVYSDWHLNERHYGALQGMNKDNAVKQYGEDQIHKWRRGYDTPPPPLGIDDPRYPGKDPKYSDLTVNELPATESLRNTFERVIPFWEKNIVPLVNQGERIVICAHGNSLRALVKHLDDISDEDITKLEIPTGIPLVYELDERLKPLKKYYLDEKALT